MKILHLSSGENFGGGERHVFELCLALSKRGHTIHVGLRLSSKLQEKFSNCPQITCHSISLKNSLDVISIRRLYKILIEEKIDILHAHYGRDYTVASIAIYFARRNRLPNLKFVFTRHHYFSLSSNWIYRYLLSAADCIIAVSSVVQEVVSTSLRIPKNFIKVIPNWINVASFASNKTQIEARNQFPAPSTAKLIGIINQLSPAKGQMEALEAFIILSTKFPNLHLIIAGDEAKGNLFTLKLKQVVKEKNLQGRVHFLGFINNISTLLQALDIVIIPSWNEAFSIGALEALAAKVPIVATNVGGLAEILENERTALLVPPRNIPAIASSVQRLLTDPLLYKKLKVSGYQKVIECYTLDSVVNKIEEVYTNLYDPG